MMDLEESIRASTTKRYNVHSSSGQRPKSKVPDLPKNDYDDTFVSNSDEVHKRQYKSMVSMSLVHLMMYLIRLNYQMVNQLNLPLMNWLTARLQVVIETKDKTFSTRPRNVDSSFEWRY